MKEKFIPLISGFALTLIIILLASFYFSSAPKISPSANADFLNENNLDQLRQVISTLNNYGDLPKNVDSNAVGKTNPFD